MTTATKWTARQTARDINAALEKAKSEKRVNDKRVRAWVRENVSAYDDDGYTSHEYDARTHARIVDAFLAKYGVKVARGTNGRARSASNGRTRGTGSTPAQVMAADKVGEA